MRTLHVISPRRTPSLRRLVKITTKVYSRGKGGAWHPSGDKPLSKAATIGDRVI